MCYSEKAAAGLSHFQSRACSEGVENVHLLVNSLTDPFSPRPPWKEPIHMQLIDVLVRTCFTLLCIVMSAICPRPLIQHPRCVRGSKNAGGLRAKFWHPPVIPGCVCRFLFQEE